MEAWNSLPTWNRDGRSIKSALQAESMKANDKRIRFIDGIDVYETAGGAVKRDLFDEQNSGYASMSPLSKDLWWRSLKQKRKSFVPMAGNGWSASANFRRRRITCHGSIPRTSR